jgi:hypothetical protein
MPSPEFLAKVRAALLPEPKPQTAQERWDERQREIAASTRYQQMIDAVWERTLIEREWERERAMERAYHRGPGDPDFR